MNPQAIAALLLPLLVNSPLFFLGPAAISAVATGLGYAAVIGGAFLISSVFAPKPPKPDDVQTNFRQATPWRSALYGTGKIGGPWIFGWVDDAGTLHRITAISSREIDGILQWWLDDKQCVRDDGDWTLTNVEGDDLYEGTVRAFFRLGETPNAYYHELESHFPDWDVDHRGDGIASLYTQFDSPSEEDFTERFPQGLNTVVSVVAKGAKIYNHLDGGQDIENPATWLYEDRASAVIFDYLRWHDGFRFPLDILNTPQANTGWSEALAHCATDIPLEDGGAEDRYRIWNSYLYNERPADVLTRFMMACNGRFRQTPDGGFTMDVGVWSEPTVTLDASHVTARSEVGRGRNIQQTANTIVSQYLSPLHDYQLQDADPWIDDADIAERGEIINSVDFICAPSHSQCRRLMKIQAHRVNPEWVGTWQFKLDALEALGERFILFSDEPMGIEEQPFEIMSFDFIFGEHSTVTGVSMALQSISEAAYTWDEMTEEGIAPPISTLDNATGVPVVENFTGITVNRNIGTSGDVGVFAQLSWDEPENKSLKTQVQGRINGSVDEWEEVLVETGATTATSFLLSEGETYEFRARHKTISGRPGDWTDPLDYVILVAVADPTAAGTLLGFGASTGLDNLGRVTLTIQVDDPDHTSKVRVWRTPSGGAFPATATLVGIIDTLDIGVYQITDGDPTRVNLYVDPSFNIPGLHVVEPSWTVANSLATRAGLAGVSWVQQQHGGLVAGDVMRATYTVSGFTAGVVAVGAKSANAISSTSAANGTYYKTFTILTGNTMIGMIGNGFAGNVDNVAIYKQTPQCLAQGTYDYYAIPYNISEIAGPTGSLASIVVI